MHPQQKFCVTQRGTVVAAELQLNAEAHHNRLATKQCLVGASELVSPYMSEGVI